MPLPTEIDQYPSTRLLLRRQIGRQKPKFWQLRPGRVTDEWQWIWKQRPHLVIPMWERETFRYHDITRTKIGIAAVNRDPALQMSELGISYLFDGSSVSGQGDYFAVPNFQYESDQATVVPARTYIFWFRVTDNSGNAFQYFMAQGQINQASSLNIYLREDAASAPVGGITFNFLAASGGGTQGHFTHLPAGGWADGRWHCMIWTHGPAKVARGYMDGLLRVTGSVAPGTGWNPTAEIRFGADGTATPSTNRFFKGQMAFIGIFRGEWTAGQVAAYYAAPWGFLTPKRGPLIGSRPADTNPDPPGTGQPMSARRGYRPHVGPRFGVN